MKYREGFDIPKEEKLEFQKEGYAYTYGEITKPGILKLLNNVNTKNKTFVDLGSGTGNVILYVKNNFPQMKEFIGIEFSKSRYIISVKKKERIKNDKNKVHFMYDTITNPNISFRYFDIIYISNLCFPESVNKILGEKISKHCKKGTIIFCSKNLDIIVDVIKTEINVSQTWSSNSKIFRYDIL
jgi:SAM-dependent methyltransferase